MAKRESGMAAKKAQAGGDFESSLAALEKIVRELERGELPLEKSLDLFEQGVRLSRECQERLNEAERRVEILLRDGDGRGTVVNALETEALRGLSVEEDTDEEEDDESVF
jgi:exodeoxyribonuclease VII small subunit